MAVVTQPVRRRGINSSSRTTINRRLAARRPEVEHGGTPGDQPQADP